MTFIGATVKFEQSRRSARVVQLLGEGGQGSVYAVDASDGQRLALKWYHAHTATASQRAMIIELIERGAPDGRFLWPAETATISGRPGFGYVMPLRPPQFVGLSALLNGVVAATLRSVCTTGYQLAESYLMLHTQGLCYRDISFGNVFFDPATGDTLICDNDNVGIDGGLTSAVMGTKRFMAPEVVRNEVRPSSATDLYSLSVLLFYLLMVGHPLLGQRELHYAMWDERAELDLFGHRPLFVFDPIDLSNRPTSGVHDAMLANWQIYPTRLRELFKKAFVAGLQQPNRRVRESEWRAELIRCRDLLRPCTRCGASNFFDATAPPATCWNCHWLLSVPLCLAFPTCNVVLSDGTEVTAHHIGRRPYDFDDIVAKVTRHPQQLDRWGLRNVSARQWGVTMPDGSSRQVLPGQSVALVPGLEANFGTARATLRVGA